MTSDGLFAGTAAYYARFRPGYPEMFFEDVVRRFRLDGPAGFSIWGVAPAS